MYAHFRTEVVLERGDYSINLEDLCSFGNLVQKCMLVFERGVSGAVAKMCNQRDGRRHTPLVSP